MCFWALDNIKRFEIETKTGRAAHSYALKGVVKEPVLTQALASDNFSFSLSRIISAILWTSLCHDWAHSLPQSLRVQVSSLPEIQFPSALPSNNTTKLKLNLRDLAQKSARQVPVQLVRGFTIREIGNLHVINLFFHGHVPKKSWVKVGCRSSRLYGKNWYYNKNYNIISGCEFLISTMHHCSALLLLSIDGPFYSLTPPTTHPCVPLSWAAWLEWSQNSPSAV